MLAIGNVISAGLTSVVIFLVILADGQKTSLDTPENIKLLHDVQKWLGDTIGRTGREGRLIESARKMGRIQDYYTGPFPCNISRGKSIDRPTSVHKLRPGDIDVIAAMGDSLSAGLGACASSMLHVLIENRGVSFSGGGQADWRTYLTLPNIFKMFNPKLIGYALSDAYVFEPNSVFNIAQSAAMSRDMPFMADRLIERIKNDSRVNVNKHWKFITLMIGPNDFCSDMCYLKKEHETLWNHKKDLLQVLRTFRDNLPRTIISILPPPNLRKLVDIDSRSFVCDLTVDVECSCLFGLSYRRKRQYYYNIMSKWQQLEEEISQREEFYRDDFAVVVQQFVKNVTFPKTKKGYSDMSFMSSDCFHLSQKAHARAANALWNNLLQPVGKKSVDWRNTYEKFVCPTEESPYIATYKNSKHSSEEKYS